jgi:citrate synthase
MSSTTDQKETYSPGLEGVIAGETAISTLAQGLSYRGYGIEELTAKSNYEEVAYLILYGELPTAQQAAQFHDQLLTAMKIPTEIVEALRKIPRGANSMDVLRSATSLLAHWEPEVDDNSHDANVRKAIRLLAQLPVAMAARERVTAGKEPVAADPSLSFAGNVLWLLRGEKPSARHVQAMDVSLILYAEHEFNASAFAARCICSTLSDLHSAITGAIGTLKGPLHGGANERALEVLLSVGSADQANKWIHDALARKERIMGFGHRVYKTGDPRAKFLKTLTVELAKETGHEDLERTADIIESVVMQEKQLPANVDWPCARLYHYLGLPIHLFTPLFVVARTVGWSAHVIEQLDNNRLMRPRSLYVGPGMRKWKPVNER